MGMNERTILIGDVHGCLEELRTLVELIRPRPSDRVLFLGDLINRGPDSAGVVRFVHDAGFECLLGNHEDDYAAEPEREPYLRLRGAIGEKRHDWLVSLPLYVDEPTFLAVHAGLEPGRSPADTSQRILVNIRTWDGVGQDLKDPDNPAWYTFYHEERPVFYGHWARAGLNIRDRTLGLDSGCVYGRRLSAYILQERHVVSVPARARYYIPPSLRSRTGASVES